ncbi:MAG: esterase, partial [Elusimicrobia bacterium]|nr:esterase [Elusimicrobiota bacterium]
HFIAGLEAIEFPATPQAPTVMLLHGYGANDADLAPLALELGGVAKARWLFPNGPLRLDGSGFSRAWFPIDVEALERAQKEGGTVDFSRSEISGLDEAAAAVERFLGELNIPGDRLVIGGFSQGAMLATEIALRAAVPPKALLVLSGNLVAEKRWRELALKRRGLRFFQSHGIADPILGFQGALRLESLLRDCGLQGQLFKFEGGHGIPSDAIAQLRGFLSETLG